MSLSFRLALQPRQLGLLALLWGLSFGASPSGIRVSTLQEDWSSFQKIVEAEYWREFQWQPVYAACNSAAEQSAGDATPAQPAHEACIRAALRMLDERSRYFTPEQSREMDKAPRRFVGLGLELSQPNSPGPIRIVQPIRGGPAYNAGLLPGDDLYSVDGVDVTRMTLQEGAALLRGEPGTSVALVVGRGDRKDLIVEVVREEIRARRTHAAFLKRERVLWVRVSQFVKTTPAELATALHEAIGDASLRPRMIVLDLRESAGGLLEGMVASTALFLAPGTAVYSEQARGSVVVKRLPSTIDHEVARLLPFRLYGDLQKVPMTVLVSEGTASGSEMFAMAMKEARGARIVGARTMGDSYITRITALPSGARMEIPIARMSTPGGISWEGTGVLLDEVRSERDREYGDPNRDRLLRHVVSPG
jgi:carboxyl-terminal processing protease